MNLCPLELVDQRVWTHEWGDLSLEGCKGSLPNHHCHQSEVCCIKTSPPFWTANHSIAALDLTVLSKWMETSEKVRPRDRQLLRTRVLNNFSAPILQVQNIQGRLSLYSPYTKPVHICPCVK